MIAASANDLPGPPYQRTRLRSVSIDGPAGRLEAVLTEGAPEAAFSALVCHPHPLYGGTLHNKVVYRAAKVLHAEFGLPVLRFNFRGVGLSQGVYDGEAEQQDVLAAVDWLERKFTRPVVVAGFSFGAGMALTACWQRPGIHALALLGLASQIGDRHFSYSFLSGCTLPKLFLSGDSDQFAPAAQLAGLVASAAEPKRLVLLPRTDHFFTGQLEPMQAALRDWLKEQIR
jgi:hypothetical protein